MKAAERDDFGKDGDAVCGPCADYRNLPLNSGYPAAPCVFCAGPTGRRVAPRFGSSPHEIGEQCAYPKCYCKTPDGVRALAEARERASRTPRKAR